MPKNRRHRKSSHNPSHRKRSEGEKIHIIAYSPDGYVESHDPERAELLDILKTWSKIWIHIVGTLSPESAQFIIDHFQLDPLAIADFNLPVHRAKTDFYDGHAFLLSQIVEHEDSGFVVDQLGMFLGSNYLITMETTLQDGFELIRDKLRSGHTRLRNLGIDALSSAIVERILLDLYPEIETLGNRLEDIEDDILVSPTAGSMEGLHEIRRKLLVIRRLTWPMRDAIRMFGSEQNEFVSPEVRPYFRENYEHAVQAIDLIETYREICSNLSDLYLSSVSNRMNEIMKFLTMVSTIFIPLSVLSGLYGMNFDHDVSPYNMPELHWRYGYPAVLAVMLITTLFQLYFFWRRGWIGRPKA